MAEYFKQTDYPEIMGIDGTQPIAEAGSFLIAQCNLLKYLNLGHEITPLELNAYYCDTGVYEKRGGEVRDYLHWNSLTRYDSTISISDIKPGWATEGISIVKFHYMSVSHPYKDDGTPNFIDHYCVLLDAERRTIIDSYDGQLKDATPYGDPIGYAIFTTPEMKLQTDTKPEHSYTMVAGDNFWDVARRLGYDAKELIEHNNITNPQELQPGYVLHLPVAREIPVKQEVRYQPLLDDNGNPERREMHIQTIGGAKKWSFANVTTWDDIESIGFYPEGTNVIVAGIAYVPVRELDGLITEAKYYMDSVSFGDYIHTKKVRYTIGFGHADMVLGRREPQKPVDQIPQEPVKIEPEILPELKPPKLQNSYKNTLQLLPDPVDVIATVNTETANARDEKGLFVWVYEHDNARRPGKLRNNREITIVATFEKQGVSYGMPKESYASKLWWGIPLDVLIPEQEVYNTDIDLVDRIATGRLTIYERIITEPLFRVIHNPRRRRWIFKHKNKE